MSKAHPPELKKFMDKKLSCECRPPGAAPGPELSLPRVSAWVKLNGGRHVQGILRGFDPFMNLVIDECVEMAPGGQQNNIGMVVIRGNSIIMLEALERV
ncbi:small nuclear ribonucleoprotein G isoform X1 [Calonectris borealis]|uniref:small nuclear ribonucleoprotein G isoform X1 n=1 Tax=Calonectris borealis TaxID=1323832 RepID=UPI003F4C5F4F